MLNRQKTHAGGHLRHSVYVKPEMSALQRLKKRFILNSASNSLRHSIAIRLLIALLSLSGAAAVVADEERGIYIGLLAPLGNFDATFDKTVDTTRPNTLVPEARRGRMLQDAVSGDGMAYGAGVLAGFRLQLGESNVFLSGQTEFNLRMDEVDAAFPGIGTSAGRNQLGEFWPDNWTYEGKRSTALIVKLGVSPESLQAMNLSVYGLAGISRLNGKFTNHFNGCLSPMPCSDASDTPNFVSGDEVRDGTDLDGRILGVGFEKSIADRLALLFEARYTSYQANSWVVNFDDVGVLVPSELEGKRFDVVLSLSRYL